MIADFIHWSWSAALQRHFLPASEDGLAKKKNSDECAPLRVNHYRHSISTHPSLPFFFLSWLAHLKFHGLLLEKYPTVQSVPKLTYLCGAGSSDSCLLIKSKQPLTELAACYLPPAGHSINLLSCRRKESCYTGTLMLSVLHQMGGR